MSILEEGNEIHSKVKCFASGKALWMEPASRVLKGMLIDVQRDGGGLMVISVYSHRYRNHALFGTQN